MAFKYTELLRMQLPNKINQGPIEFCIIHNLTKILEICYQQQCCSRMRVKSLTQHYSATVADEVYLRRGASAQNRSIIYCGPA